MEGPRKDNNARVARAVLLHLRRRASIIGVVPVANQRKVLTLNAAAQAATAVPYAVHRHSLRQDPGKPQAYYVFCFLLYKRSVTRALPTVCQ